MFPSAGAAWTLDDLLRLPATGHRYEIVDGSLLVSPPPEIRHTVFASRLDRLLDRAAPASLTVLPTGAGVQIGRSLLVPDVLVANTRAAHSASAVFAAADVVLVVEVLSPSNRTTDLVTKRATYAAGGIPSYWLVDPTVPSLTVLRLRGDTYETAATISGGDPFTTDEPFPVTVVPAHLALPPAGNG